MKEIEPKRSTASWLVELAKGRYGEYALSVLTALLGVACSLIPYFIIIRLITALVNGTAELTYCLMLCAWMAGFWVLRYVLHSVSTSLSHHATFYVLAHTRIRLLDKLATLPLGTVLDRSSGCFARGAGKNSLIIINLRVKKSAKSRTLLAEKMFYFSSDAHSWQDSGGHLYFNFSATTLHRFLKNAMPYAQISLRSSLRSYSLYLQSLI